jgi:acetyl-CoA carboxylase biotin carboxyl carrier protein
MYDSQNAPRYAGYGVPTVDPEVAKLHQAEVEAAREAAALAGQFNTASSDLRDEIRGQLREALARQFDAQQERRSQEIASIEERLAALKDILQKRNEARDAIVDRRLNQLTGVQDELGWEETGLGPHTVGPTAPAWNSYPAPPQAAAPLAPPSHVSPAAPSEDEGLVPIKSPMVGTFYSAADPNSPPFVTEGSTVTVNTVVCIVEAMKVFNEIKAEVSGTIARVLVKNEEPVEFGQALYLVRPT